MKAVLQKSVQSSFKADPCLRVVHKTWGGGAREALSQERNTPPPPPTASTYGQVFQNKAIGISSRRSVNICGKGGRSRQTGEEKSGEKERGGRQGEECKDQRVLPTNTAGPAPNQCS